MKENCNTQHTKTSYTVVHFRFLPTVTKTSVFLFRGIFPNWGIHTMCKVDSNYIRHFCVLWLTLVDHNQYGQCSMPSDWSERCIIITVLNIKAVTKKKTPQNPHFRAPANHIRRCCITELQLPRDTSMCGHFVHSRQHTYKVTKEVSYDTKPTFGTVTSKSKYTKLNPSP